MAHYVHIGGSLTPECWLKLDQNNQARYCLSPKAHKATKRAVRKELSAKALAARPITKRETKVLQEVDEVEPIKAHPS